MLAVLLDPKPLLPPCELDDVLDGVVVDVDVLDGVDVDVVVFVDVLDGVDVDVDVDVVELVLVVVPTV